jgi:hypothetical protein
MDIEKLQDHNVKNAFILQLKNRFQALTDIPDTIESETTVVNTKWEHIRAIYEKSSEECLGYNVGKKMKKLITPGTCKVIEEKTSYEQENIRHKI